MTHNIFLLSCLIGASSKANIPLVFMAHSFLISLLPTNSALISGIAPSNKSNIHYGVWVVPQKSYALLPSSTLSLTIY
jgi:hypothetical protein